MQTFETDYLIIGAGAVGLAFADTLLEETNAHITIVDRRATPGGHWNDAYPFVALHQPSAFYGVNSVSLGSGQRDVAGPNTGLYELASGAQVSAYFSEVMQKFLGTGRVRYLPSHDHQGDGLVAPLDGVVKGNASNTETIQIQVRKKWVDATAGSPQVPATRKPNYAVGDSIRVIPPNDLPINKNAEHFVIVGAGKTAMDVGVWLLAQHIKPKQIHWVVPRDSWLINRLTTQPSDDFFFEAIGGQSAQMAALAKATSIDDLFLRMEAANQMFRIDREQTPTMFHFATISQGEVETLRTIDQVIRKGRVNRIDSSGLHCEAGHHAIPANALYIDCTASAVEPRSTQPMFQGKKIVPQLVRAPQPAFSAAFCAYVEAHYDDDEKKNKLCAAVPFPHSLADYPRTIAANLINQMAWRDEKPIRDWLLKSRLDGFSKMIAAIDRDDEERQAVLVQLRANVMGAMFNIPKLNGQ